MTDVQQKDFVVSKNVRTNGTLIFCLYLVLMLGCLFLRNALGVNIPPVFFLMITAVSLILGDQNQIIATAVCCIPFSTGFQFKYALLLCILVLAVKNRKYFRLTLAFVVVVILAIWELIHGIGGMFSIMEYPRSMAEFIFLGAVFSFWDKKSLNYRLILRGYSVAMIGVCFIMFYLQLAQNGFSVAALLSQGDFFRFGQENTDFAQYALNFNPNSLGFSCCLCVACSLFFLRRREFRLIDGVLLFFSVGFCVMTLSRTAVVCLAVLVLGYLLLLPMPGIKKLGYLLFMATLLAVVIALLYQIMPAVFDNLFARFQESDGFSGRDVLFAFYNQHLLSSPVHFFFGIGIQQISTKITQIHGISINVSHNGYQEAMVVWGVVGLVCVLLLLYSVICETRGEHRRKLIAFVPFGMLLLYVMAGQLVSAESTLMSILLVAVILSAEGHSLEGVKHGKR